jgi:hypothetical protein
LRIAGCGLLTAAIFMPSTKTRLFQIIKETAKLRLCQNVKLTDSAIHPLLRLIHLVAFRRNARGSLDIAFWISP